MQLANSTSGAVIRNNFGRSRCYGFAPYQHHHPRQNCIAETTSISTATTTTTTDAASTLFTSRKKGFRVPLRPVSGDATNANRRPVGRHKPPADALDLFPFEQMQRSCCAPQQPLSMPVCPLPPSRPPSRKGSLPLTPRVSLRRRRNASLSSFSSGAATCRHCDVTDGDEITDWGGHRSSLLLHHAEHQFVASLFPVKKKSRMRIPIRTAELWPSSSSMLPCCST